VWGWWGGTNRAAEGVRSEAIVWRRWGGTNRAAEAVRSEAIVWRRWGGTNRRPRRPERGDSVEAVGRDKPPPKASGEPLSDG